MRKILDAFSEVVDTQRRWNPEWYSWFDDFEGGLTALEGALSILQDDVTNLQDDLAALQDALTALQESLRTKLDGDTTFYVSTTGSNDTGDGSFANPWLTGQNAGVQILNGYDGGGSTITLQLIGSPFNVPAGESFFYGGFPPVGIGQLIIRGNPANPADFVIDGTLNGGDGAGINIGPNGAGLSIRLDGVTMQNWGNQAINLQSKCFVEIGAVTFINNDTDFDVEAGSHIVRGDGTVTFSGTHGQMLYCAESFFDFNTKPTVFVAGCSFSFVVLNVDGGRVSFSGSVTGTCTGTRAFIGRGGSLSAVDAGGAPLAYASLPGSVNGMTNGGWYNGSQLVPAIPVASLPALPGTLVGGERYRVTNATATTFGSVVVGGGANVVPVYNDGAGNWRIG